MKLEVETCWNFIKKAPVPTGSSADSELLSQHRAAEKIHKLIRISSKSLNLSWLTRVHQHSSISSVTSSDQQIEKCWETNPNEKTISMFSSLMWQRTERRLETDESLNAPSCCQNRNWVTKRRHKHSTMEFPPRTRHVLRLFSKSIWIWQHQTACHSTKSKSKAQLTRFTLQGGHPNLIQAVRYWRVHQVQDHVWVQVGV